MESTALLLSPTIPLLPSVSPGSSLMAKVGTHPPPPPPPSPGVPGPSRLHLMQGMQAISLHPSNVMAVQARLSLVQHRGSPLWEEAQVAETPASVKLSVICMLNGSAMQVDLAVLM